MDYLNEIKQKIDRGDSMTTKELSDYWNYLNSQNKMEKKQDEE